MVDHVLLSADGIQFGYGERPVLHDTSVGLRSGDLVALVGPNGSGKTTLLKLLCGILAPQSGRVAWNGQDIKGMRRQSLARQISFVPQELNLPYAFTVAEIIGLGRTPHIRALFGESDRDRTAVARALDLTGTRELANRYYGELSGGEQQRVAIAMALAQIMPQGNGDLPHVLLLDEPTVHLDINHQVEVLDLVQRLNREQGLTVLATMHDLNLASFYFDRLILLYGGKIDVDGLPKDVLSKERIQAVFHADVVIQPHPARDAVPHIILLSTNGNGRH